MSTSSLWHVRGADSQAEGRLIEFERLTRAIIDGVLGEEDQVRGSNDARWTLIGEHPQLEEYLPPRPLFRRREGEAAEMDMTPMIDVTFQLLIFFMLTAAFVVQKTLDMPRAKEESLTRRPPTLTMLQQKNVFVVLKRDGSMTVDGKPASLEGLTATLRAAANSRDNRELVLDVEDDVEHEMVVRVLDHAADAAMQNVLFVNRTGRSGKSKAG